MRKTTRPYEEGGTDAEALRAALRKAVDQRSRDMWRPDAGAPSPELLDLIRRSAELAGTDQRRRARLLVVAALLHDLADERESAERLYAQARGADPYVARHGHLADVRRRLAARRERALAAGVVTTGPHSSRGAPQQPGREAPRPASDSGRRSRAP